MFVRISKIRKQFKWECNKIKKKNESDLCAQLIIINFVWF